MALTIWTPHTRTPNLQKQPWRRCVLDLRRMESDDPKPSKKRPTRHCVSVLSGNGLGNPNGEPQEYSSNILGTQRPRWVYSHYILTIFLGFLILGFPSESLEKFGFQGRVEDVLWLGPPSSDLRVTGSMWAHILGLQ